LAVKGGGEWALRRLGKRYSRKLDFAGGQNVMISDRNLQSVTVFARMFETFHHGEAGYQPEVGSGVSDTKVSWI
jgi:hypothetical protein